MSEYANKLLVALDGSARSRETVQYLASFSPFKNFELVLFSVMSRVPESFYDLRSDDFNPAALSRVRIWENSRKALMEEFMVRSRNKLIAGGFKPEQIEVKIAGKQKGVARDILAEARKGYDALVLRRRGWANAVLPLALGSVSTKVLDKATDIPVILAGVQPVTHTILVAFDGSPGAMKALDFLARTVSRSECRIILGTVVRDGGEEKDPTTDAGLDVISEELGRDLDQSVTQAFERLGDAGISMDRVLVRTARGVKSRAMALADMAIAEGCGTVVLGRRGKTNVSEFSMGRVPWKVVHGVRKMTVWVIP